MKDKELTRQEIRNALQTALLGEIYPAIRSVAYKYSYEEKSFLLRYYLDREPKEFDYECVSIVMSEFISYFKFSDFDVLKEECVFSMEIPSKLDILDGFVYFRKENIDY